MLIIDQFENHQKGVCSYAITGPNDLVNEFFTLEQIVLDDGTNNAAAQLRLLKRLDRNVFNHHLTTRWCPRVTLSGMSGCIYNSRNYGRY